MYDCIIIGMGCAGMSAGIYAKRAGLKTLMLDENMPGSALNKVNKIENYLGFKSITGSELAYQMFEHIEAEEVEYKILKVLSIENNDEFKIVHTNNGNFKTRGIIISSGRKYKKSGIANEAKYIGKGVSYCTTCDAPLYKNKNVVVIGNNDDALENATYLSRFASDVKVISSNKMNAMDSSICNAQVSNVKIIDNVKVIEFLGDEYINGIKLSNNKIIPCDGVFIYFGDSADSNFISSLGITDDKGYILVDSSMKTKYDGIYACGDIIKKEVYQIATAVGEGAIAATCLKRELEK